LGKAKPSPQPSATQQTSPSPQATTVPTSAKEYDTCTVQVRLTNGTTITKDFKPTDTLRGVHNWVATSRTDNQHGPFALSTAYPRKDYSGSALDVTTLKSADLVPRGSLMVKNL